MMKKFVTLLFVLLPFALSSFTANAEDSPQQDEAFDYIKDRRFKVSHLHKLRCDSAMLNQDWHCTHLAAVFNTIDPKADQYPELNPYLYCAGNPIRYIDQDGTKILFSEDCTPGFRRAFRDAIKFMNLKGTSSVFYRLQKNDITIYISMATYVNENGDFDSDYGNRFDPNTMTIYWNPSLEIIWNDGTPDQRVIKLSTVTMLIHEGTHAEIFITNPSKYESDMKTKDEKFTVKGERDAINAETEAAIKHGEIKEGEGRKDHSGENYPNEDLRKKYNLSEYYNNTEKR